MRKTLQERIAAFDDLDHGRVTRDQSAYDQTLALTTSEIQRLLDAYGHEHDMQRRRLLRDSMDHWLRRYHGYTINGSIGCHYRAQGLQGKGIFEHVIPASTIRDMLIGGVLTISQALHAPVCRISGDDDRMLGKRGRASHTPDAWLFFSRYDVLPNLIIETHDGEIVDTATWTLQNHYDRFGE